MRKRFSMGFPSCRAGAVLLACVLATLGAPTAGAAEPTTHTVRDPHYGDGLFHFYQDRYFSSITTLMVSQHFDRLRNHTDEAELLRGGMLLSYGLHREAGEVFARLIDQGSSPSVRDRAWYYVAKIRYQRNYLAEAEEALARIGNQLPADLEDDRRLLHANLLMARADYTAAATVLGGVAGDSPASHYARYNLGVARVRDGQLTEGLALLDGIGKSPMPPPPSSKARAPIGAEEFQSLRDKANLALGYAALRERKPDEARGFLERVRLNGLQSNKALLGFGWAADALNDPRLALVPWTELAGRDSTDEAVLEARIAVPYAYAALRAYGQALDRYTDAITTFERESTGLDESIAAIRSGQLLASLLGSNPGDEMGWFGSLERLPAGPHAARLAPVLATHEFQEAFKNYRDLQFLAANLNDWADKLGIFDDMLDNRRRAYAERLPRLLAQADASGPSGFQRRRDGLAAELAQAEASHDTTAFANALQREQLARLAGVLASLQQAGSAPDAEAARERARRIAGALVWELDQAYAPRLWNAQRELAGTDAALAEAYRHEAALVQAQHDEPARFDAFGARIKAFGPRLQVLIPQVTALQAEQQRALQELAVAQLLRQKERLVEYTSQARFAVAQLYDRASLDSGAAHATKP